MGADGARTISKGDLAAWLAALMRRAEVIAPVADHGGDVSFAPISSPEQVVFEFGNTLYPPKGYVLPQVDPLVAIERGDRGYQIRRVLDVRPRVLFNVRSCDAAGIAFLKRVHASDLPDGGFLARTETLTVVTLACTVPCEHGFCTCSNAGPFLADGYDLQLTDLGDRLLAEPGSEAGAALLAEAENLFRPVVSEETCLRLELEEGAKQPERQSPAR